jgi:hypothetical protein
MQPPDAVAGWDDDLNARFTRDYPFYADTSRDLAERVSLPGARSWSTCAAVPGRRDRRPPHGRCSRRP